MLRSKLRACLTQGKLAHEPQVQSCESRYQGCRENSVSCTGEIKSLLTGALKDDFRLICKLCTELGQQGCASPSEFVA